MVNNLKNIFKIINIKPNSHKKVFNLKLNNAVTDKTL